jgi:phage-related protein
MTAVSDWWTNTVVPAWNAGFEAVSGWLGDLGDWFGDVWQGIRDAVDTAVAFVVAITRTQLNIWRTIIDTAVAVVRGVFAWFGELPGMLRGWFTQAAVAVAEKTGEVVAFVTGLPGRILSAIGNAGQMLYNVGRDVISGLWNGLQSMATWIRNKVTGLVSSILPGPVKDILGIASPSKLFRYYGQMTGEGLGLGLEDEAGFVARQAGALADAVVAPMDAVSASLGGTGLGVSVSGATATTSVVEVRHVVELPDGTTGTYSAEEWARLIASDREASAVLEKAVRRQQQSNAARTLVAANG